jgi:VanZ family protein
MSKKFIDYIPALIIALMIMYLGTLPGKELTAAGLGKESYHINGHFLFFSALCFFLYKPLKNIYLCIIITVLYGVMLELIQIYVPARAASLFDVFTDTMGALISALILWKLQSYLPKILRNWLNQ